MQHAFPGGLLTADMNLQFAGVVHVENPNFMPLAIPLHQEKTALNQKIFGFQDSPGFDFLILCTILRTSPTTPDPQDNTSYFAF